MRYAFVGRAEVITRRQPQSELARGAKAEDHGTRLIARGAEEDRIAVHGKPKTAPSASTQNEPPLVLPLAVMAGALYVLWRGAGRWSLDVRMARSRSE